MAARNEHWDEQSTAISLLDRFGETAATRQQPVWLQWRSGPGNPQTREITGPDGLLGRTVPPDWDGAAVVGTGRFRLLDEAHEPPAVLKPGFAGGLAMACVVCRDGAVGWRMRLPDGTFYDRIPEEGFMLDVLRRSLGLATPPPSASVAPLELAAWFAAIVEASSEEGRRLDWCEALLLHPANMAASPADVGGAEALVRERAANEEWEMMRRLVASGLGAAAAPPPALAHWMDAGMFSRWVLDGLPPLGALLSMVRPHLQPDARRHLRHLARALDDRAAVA